MIVTEDRRACDGHCSVNHPVVACTKHAKSTQSLNLLVLFQHAKVDALIFNSRRDNQWMARIIPRFQFYGSFDTHTCNDTGSLKINFPTFTSGLSPHFLSLLSVVYLPLVR